MLDQFIIGWIASLKLWNKKSSSFSMSKKPCDRPNIKKHINYYSYGNFYPFLKGSTEYI